MATWIGYGVLAAAISYLLGAIPTGYCWGKLHRGIDIREHGSKSIGATNVLRTLGKGPAVIVVLVDLLKGVAAVTATRWLLTKGAPIAVDITAWLPWAVSVSALLAILGHSRSIWIQFSGGKSAATGLGVLLAMSWQVGLGVALVFAVVLAVSRIVSLSSMSAAVSAIVLMVVFQQPIAFLLTAIAGGLYVIWRHKSNIQRLLAGTEPRLGQSPQGTS